jgi:hypothetical protein
MAFTEAQLQTAIDTAVSGSGCEIIRFDATSSASFTDVTVQNMNTSARKTGTVQVAQSNNATQAAAAILAALT